MNYFYQNEPVTSVTMSGCKIVNDGLDMKTGKPVEAATGGPTERQLEWMRENIPHFKTAERQALSARAAKREAAG